MVILDAIASVNKSNQYYFSNSGHHQSNAQPSSSSYKNNVGVAPRHYPGKAVDVSLSLEPSNAMGALYEANWVNAHQAMMTKKPQQQQQPPTLMTSVNGGKSSPPSTQPPSIALRRQPQPECHSPPHLRNKPSPPLSLKHGNSGRESSSSSSSSATTTTPPHNNAPNNRLSSLGQYQVTLDQIRRLEEKDANITKTICELNGFKPTPLRRRQRQLYPDWDEHNSRNRKMADEEEENEEMSNSQRGQKINFAQRQEQLQREGEEEEEEVVRRSDLVSQFLKLKNNKKFPKPENNNNWNQEENESYGNNKLVDDDNDNNREKYRDKNGTLPLRNSMRGFCGSAIDLKEMFRRKKDAELSPKMNNKVSVSNGGRKIYPKTINLTKNLVRDPVILDPSTQPTFLAEKHRYHHRSHPNLQSNYDEEEVFQRERDAEARRNMKFNQRNCDSSSPTSNTTVDHDYEVIDYQDVVLREKPVKRSNTTVSRAKSVRINPVADLIVDSGGAQPRNGFSKWKNNRSSMPVTVDTGNKYNTVTPSVAAAAVNGQQHSPPHTSGAGKSSAVRRSKSINPSSFLDNWNRRQREESEVKPPPPATGSSLRHQQSLRQQPIRPKLVHLSPSISQSPSPNHQVDKRRESPNREVNNNNNNSDDQDQFIIPRPRLIVPVHTYARKRRTGNLRAAEEEEEASQNSGAKDAGKTIR